MRAKKVPIPATALGTRMLPITKSMPKEMLPVDTKPIIHYVVEEVIKADIDDILITTGKEKRPIEDYFDQNFKLKYYLRERGKEQELKFVRGISEMVGTDYIMQKKPPGLGDAVLHAEKHVNGEPFAVLLGDDIIVSERPGIGQLVEVYEGFNAPVLGVETVEWEAVEKYGIVAGEEVESGLYRVEDLVEKPKREEAPSNITIVGRYVLPPEIFDALRKVQPEERCEIQLNALRLLVENGQSMYAKTIEGKRYDVGAPERWLRANVELGRHARILR